MKKFILTIVAAIFTFNAFAQFHISSDEYVYEIVVKTDMYKLMSSKVTAWVEAGELTLDNIRPIVDEKDEKIVFKNVQEVVEFMKDLGWTITSYRPSVKYPKNKQLRRMKFKKVFKNDENPLTSLPLPKGSKSYSTTVIDNDRW